MKESAGTVNLLELKPVQNAEASPNADGTVSLLVPKFQGRFLSRWLVPYLAKPHVHLKLDPLGTFFWNACDGKTSVRDIAGKMGAHFGQDSEAMLDRINTFLRRLDESKVVLFDGAHELIGEGSKKGK